MPNVSYDDFVLPVISDQLPGKDQMKMIGHLSEQITTLRRELQAAKKEADDAAVAHQRFRELVVAKATEAANEHDWCEVVDDVLEELGLNDVKVVRRVQVTLVYEIPRTIGDELPEANEAFWTFARELGVARLEEEATEIEAEYL